MEERKFTAKPLYKVKEVAEITNNSIGYINDLIKAGLLPCLVLKHRTVRHDTLMEFLQRYEGYDLSNPYDIKKLEF